MDCIFHTSLLQPLVDLRLGKGSIGTKDYPFAQLPLVLDLGEQHFVPVFGSMYLAKPQLCRRAVSFAVEQRQRVMEGGLEVAVLCAVLPLAVHRNLG